MYQSTRHGKQGVYAGDCEGCGLPLMKDDPNREFERDDFKRHTDKACPRCGKRISKEV